MAKQIVELTPVANDAEEEISFDRPYRVEVSIEGVAPFLFHRWSNEAVATKGKAAKGSTAKKTDNVESYVWRMSDGDPTSELAIPGEYLRQSICTAAKFMQDPRSPRKSAMDLFKAGVISLTERSSVGQVGWDAIDQRRVMVQRSGISRSRPMLAVGWKASFIFQIQLPQYIDQATLHKAVTDAGVLIGVGDFRPSYGRFRVTKFQPLGD